MVNKKHCLRRLIGAFLAGIFVVPVAIGAEQEVADLVIHNAAIYTVNEQQPWAKAVAVKDGKITYIGDNKEARKWIGEETRTIDAHSHWSGPKPRRIR